MTDHYLKGARWVLENDNFTYEGILNANGKADLRNIALGDYKFTLTKNGYETKTIDVTVSPEPINIEIDLQPIPRTVATEVTEEEKPKTKKRTSKKSKKTTSTEEPEEKTEEKPKKTSKRKSSKRKSTKKTEKTTAEKE